MTWLLLLALAASPVKSVSLAPDSPCAPRAALARELARVGLALDEGHRLDVRLAPTETGLELSLTRDGTVVLRRTLQGSCDEASGATAVILERYVHELPAPEVTALTASAAEPSATRAPRGPRTETTAVPRPIPPETAATPGVPRTPREPPRRSLPSPLPETPPLGPSADSQPPPPGELAPSASTEGWTAPPPPPQPTEEPRREPVRARPQELPQELAEERPAPPPIITLDVRPGPPAAPTPVAITDWQVLTGGGALGPTPATLSPLLELQGSLLLADRWRLGLLALFSFGGSVPVTQTTGTQETVTRGTLWTGDLLALPEAGACTSAAALRLCGGVLAGLRLSMGQASGDLLFQTALKLAPTFTAGAQVDLTLRLGAFRAALAASLLINPEPATFGVQGLGTTLSASQFEGLLTLAVGLGAR